MGDPCIRCDEMAHLVEAQKLEIKRLRERESQVISATLVMCECMPEKQDDFEHLQQVILSMANVVLGGS